MNETATAFDFTDIARETVARHRLPRATYRLQFNRAFRFRDAIALIPYLSDLGISDLYASPIFQACSASGHGYDISNYNRINPDLGQESDLDELIGELAKRDMGLILDVVPNHMGIRDAHNAWWMDVLENGPSSTYARYFDIDWKPVKRELKNRVLLPILEDQYGTTLESGKLRLVFEDGSFFIRYHETVLPVTPRTYSGILGHRLDWLSEQLGPEDPHLQELQSILTALSYLPSRTELDPGKIAERSREKEVVKRRIAALYKSSPELRSAIEATVRDFNGNVDDPHSFDELDELLDKQVYRPAFWKVAAEEINYRRFFDINDLAAIRVEDPEVFQASHELLFRLLTNRHITGLRVDHADGLWDPAGYLRQLQSTYLQRISESRMSGAPVPGVAAGFAEWHTSELEAKPVAPPNWPVYVAVEKILLEGESLPPDWAAHGTTGYDFLNAANGLFIDSSNEDTFTSLYAEFIDKRIDFDALVNSTKKMTMLVSLASEIYSLSHQLDSISERNRRYRDFTLDSFTFGIREVIASLGVYRTYISGPVSVSQRDRGYIEAAVDDARRRNSRTPAALFDFIRDTLLLQNIRDFRRPDRAALIDWVMRFQQITGPVMAKGVEDTAFYVFNRLLSLNEVGGNPRNFGISPEAFHRKNVERLRRWPHSMLASSTHDTKRSEDVRARINVLSEMPSEWRLALVRWRALNAPKKVILGGEPAPDANDEYHLYQTLLGVWPSGAPRVEEGMPERVAAYMQKTIKEAKIHTSWVNPNREYEHAVENFILKALGDEAFLHEFLPFQRRIEHYGQFNALAQLLLKLTCPGVPDLYQGSEIWDLHLVDPDNRGVIDYQVRMTLLAGLKTQLANAGAGLFDCMSKLMKSTGDGLAKIYTIYRTLSFRRQHPDLFAKGDYFPLEAIGSKRVNVCAFSRSLGACKVVVVVPRLVVGLTEGVQRPPLREEVWRDTWLWMPTDRPAGRYRDLFTGGVLSVGERDDKSGVPVASILAGFPIALLERMGDA
jgi:(1->4)-alpha-D-glucan 1-alpha-D-glucosylmutase